MASTVKFHQPSSEASPPLNQLTFFPDKRKKDFQALLEKSRSSDTIVISCADYREKPREGYLLTSAGAIPHKYLMEDLHLLLPGKKVLLLRGHTDCAKSKAEVTRLVTESDLDYSKRVEQHTLDRLWQAASTILGDKKVQGHLKNGLKFCVALYDVFSGTTTFFEAASDKLSDKFLNGKRP